MGTNRLRFGIAFSILAALLALTTLSGQEPEDYAALSDAQLEHRIFSRDRHARLDACEEARKRAERGSPPLGEHVWLRLLDVKCSDDDEQEELFVLALSGLRPVATERSLETARKFMLREARVKLDIPPVEFDPDGGLGGTFDAHPYGSEAYHIYIRLMQAKMASALESTLGNLQGIDRADEIGRMLAVEEVSFDQMMRRYLSTAAPDKRSRELVQPYFPQVLMKALTSMGGTGVWGLSHAITRSQDPTARGHLCRLLAEDAAPPRTNPQPQSAFLQFTPEDIAGWNLRYRTYGKTRRSLPNVYAAVLRRNKDAYEAIVATVRSVLGDPDKFTGEATAALGLIADFDLTEVEVDVMKFVEWLERGSEESRREFLPMALRSLGWINTDSALDFLVRRGSIEGTAGAEERLVPRLMDALERAEPDTYLYCSLAGALANTAEIMDYTDVERYEKVLGRARVALQSATNRRSKLAIEDHIRCTLEPRLARLKKHKEDQKGGGSK